MVLVFADLVQFSKLLLENSLLTARCARFCSDRNCPTREFDELVDGPNNSISVVLPKDLFVVAEEAVRRCHISRDSASGAEFME